MDLLYLTLTCYMNVGLFNRSAVYTVHLDVDLVRPSVLQAERTDGESTVLFNGMGRTLVQLDATVLHDGHVRVGSGRCHPPFYVNPMIASHSVVNGEMAWNHQFGAGSGLQMVVWKLSMGQRYGKREKLWLIVKHFPSYKI